ncbi:hypothetical protein M088_1501 [Bacteroides ovatus str. 3725 D1 iv]|nr:hypothetical protein M088_1501 [Bacteroides ovatus str. 3725 D1 iv]
MKLSEERTALSSSIIRIIVKIARFLYQENFFCFFNLPRRSISFFISLEFNL